MDDRGDAVQMRAGTFDVELVPVRTPNECRRLAATLAAVWGMSDAAGVIAPDALRAMVHSGCYAVAVRVVGEAPVAGGDSVIGGGFGWPANGSGEWRLHSHVVGFLGPYRALGLGHAVKHHQRAWAAVHGLAAVEWTYDPLVVANARFNVVKLGARVTGFHLDFYGAIADEFSNGLRSDRFLVRWGIDDSASAYDEPVDADGAFAVLAVGPDGEPVVTTAPTGSARLLAAVPSDIVAIRRRDPALAMRWTDAFAATVGVLVDHGGRVATVTADGVYVIDC